MINFHTHGPHSCDRRGARSSSTPIQAWLYGKTLQAYRIGAQLRYSGVEDLDWRRDWNPDQQAYGDPYTISDATIYITNDLYRWEGEDEAYTYSPPGPGTITYRVRWWDNNDPQGTQDAEVWDSHPIAVVNNTYPGWSSIETDSRFLSKRELYDLVAPPTPASLFDGGQVHARVGDELWVTECRHVRSYTVDVYTGESTIARLQEAYEFTYYFYGDPANDDPNYLPGHLVRSTLEPGDWEHTRDHAGLPNMLTPPSNPSITGSLCVVKGRVDVDQPIPHKQGDPATTITYVISPQEMQLAPVAEPVVIRIWDPIPYGGGYSYRKKWIRDDPSGTIVWSGWLDEYCQGELVETDVQFCGASMVFSEIDYTVWDRFWAWGDVQEWNVGPWTDNHENLSIWVLQTATTGVTELQSGVNFTLHYAVQDFTPTSFSISIPKAFRPKGGQPQSLPYTSGDLIHPDGGTTSTTSTANPLLTAVYETGSRSLVGDTDLGTRTITVTAMDANGVEISTSMDLTVMREANLTAYFTPHEVNPHYVGKPTTYSAFSRTDVPVWTGTSTDTIYVDSDFLADAEVQGYGKLYRIRESALDGFSSGTVPPTDRQFIGYDDKIERWFFSDNAYGATGTVLTINSAARNATVPGGVRSYYNFESDYGVPDLRKWGGEYIDTCDWAASRPEDPPDGRFTDDQGGALHSGLTSISYQLTL